MPKRPRSPPPGWLSSQAACAEGGGHCTGEKVEETITIEEAEEIEVRLRAEIEALRRDLSTVLQHQHERLLKLEAGEGPGKQKAKEEGEEEEATDPPAVITVDDLDGRGQEVELSRSTWDACLLVGAPCLGIWGSLTVCLCTLLNIAIQTIFVALVFANFLETEFSEEDIDGFKAWRLMVAHDDRYTSLQGVPLAARVCGQDPTLELSNEQSTKVELIRSYLPSLDPELSSPRLFSKDWLKTVFDGSVMCCVAVSCWVLTVAKEVGSTFDMLGVVLGMPFSRRLGVQVGEAPGGSCRIISAGIGSKVFMVFVLSVRLAVALALLAMGCLYLAYTSSMQDLLLNAVALECVMTIDELVYEALAPRRVRQVMKNLAPLRLQPWPRRLRAFDVKTVVLSALLAGLLLLVGQGPLRQHVDNLQMAHSQLCGGRVDFASGIDPLNVVSARDTQPFSKDEAFQGLGERIPDLAALELMASTAKENRRYSLTPNDYAFTSLAMLRTADIQSAMTGIYSHTAELNCHDALDLPLQNASGQVPEIRAKWDMIVHHRQVWLTYLRSLPGSSPTGQSCADFSHLCGQQLVTAVCPHTCGCDFMLQGGIWELGNADCPMNCRRTVAALERATTTCEDAKFNNASDPKWQRLMEYGRSFEGYEAVFASQGCAALLNQDIAHNLCLSPSWLQASSPMRTSFTPADQHVAKLITYVCPETCNCAGRGGPRSSHLAPQENWCPDTCVCPWEYPTTPASNSSNCTVAHYVPGYTLAPLDVDAKCCFLMNEYSRLLGTWLGGVQDDYGWVPLQKTICHTCYLECQSKLWGLPVVENPNWTFPSLFFLILTGSAVPPASMREIVCFHNAANSAR